MSTTEDKQEACRTFVDQTKQLITLASAVTFAPAGFVALYKDLDALKKTDFVTGFCWTEGSFIVSMLGGYIAMGAIAGAQYDGSYNVYRSAARFFGIAQVVAYISGVAVFVFWIKKFLP